MNASPILWRWTGEAMEPLPRFRKLCDERFTVGEVYRQETVEERSIVSHNHYFAALTEVWRNLPDLEAERFPSVEHLRKWCLIKAGYSNQQNIVCATRAEALRLPAIVRGLDEFAVTIVRENVVSIFTAQSQSKKAMGAKPFQDSKQKVLEIAASMIGVSPDALSSNARQAA